MVKSTGKLNKILKELGRVNNKMVEVGIVKPETKRNGRQNVQLAAILKYNEEGTRHIPKRATLIPAARDAKYKPRVKSLISNIAFGNGLVGLQKIGEVAALKAKSNIQGIKQPPLKPSTIRNRVNAGTTNPLVDTGQLKRGIGVKISDRRKA